MEKYYLIQLSNHLFSMLDLIFFRRKSEEKFFEWLTHHFIALNLLVFSSTFGFVISGC